MQLLTDAEIAAKPSVLLIGQYSVGKTTFIRNLVGRDFGQRIGPVPHPPPRPRPGLR